MAPDATNTSIRIERVTKVYGSKNNQGVIAVEDVSLTVDKGEVVALLGPSGCGKSTLLKMVAGLYPATGGSITVEGVEVAEPSLLTGIMFQTPVLFPWLTVLDNVLLPGRVRGGKKKSHLEKARNLVDLVGLAGFHDSYPWQLSGGMQQRAAICRMLMSEPQVLLLDEPFGALDEMTREFMDAELRALMNQRDCSALFVTHNPLEAAFIADRVVVLTPRPGRVSGEVRISLGRERPTTLFSSRDLHESVTAVRDLLKLPRPKDPMSR